MAYPYSLFDAQRHIKAALHRYGSGVSAQAFEIWKRDFAKLGNRVLLDSYSKAIADFEGSYSIVFGGNEMIEAAAISAVEGSAAFYQTLPALYKQAVRDRRGTWQKDWVRVGLGANQAALRAYNTRKVGGYPSDRSDASKKLINRRYGGGRLARAIDSPNMFRAVNDGVFWGNQQWLTINALQWARINFGTAEAAGVAPRRFSSTLLQGTVSGLGLQDHSKRAPMFLPKGVWDGKKFTPVGELKGNNRSLPRTPSEGQNFNPNWRPTAGIRATQYLDAGIGYITQMAPRVIEQQLQEVLSYTLKSGGQKGAPVRIAADADDIRNLHLELSRKVAASHVWKGFAKFAR